MTAQRGTRRAQAAAETRELILRAARDRLAAQGYAGTTLNDIAAAAGVAVATVYTSVGGKPMLLEELVRRSVEGATVVDTMRLVESAGSGADIVRAIAGGTGSTYHRDKDLITLLLDGATHEPVAQRLLTEAVDDYQKALAYAAERLDELDALAEGVDRTRARDVLWYFFGLYSWPHLIRDSAWSWEEASEWLYATAERALLRDA